MKKNVPLNQIIYLSDYFVGNIAQSFQKEDLEILYWDFGKEVNETVKLQIEQLLNHAVKTIKDKEGANINSIVICKSKLLAAENKLEEAIQFFSKHIQFFTDQSKNTFCERLQSHYTFNS